LERGLLQRGKLEAAREKIAGRPPAAPASPDLLDLLVAEGALDPVALCAALAEASGLPVVALGPQLIGAGLLASVPVSFARQHTVLPYARTGDVLHLAVADPFALDVVDHLAYVTGLRIAPALATAAEIRAAITRHHESRENLLSAAGSAPPDLAPEPVLTTEGPHEQEGEAGERDAPIIRLVHAIITEAVRQRASDIHLEPLARRFRVRYRIDGVLSEVDGPPKQLQPAVVSRLKIMANMSIAEKRVPQDGRIQLAAEGRSLDVRVSSLPTAHGESIVMRILDQAGLKLGLPELGLLPDDEAQLSRQLASPDGMVLVTGPTGAGKTTTLYACLHRLNQADRKIITVEDPVEYQLSGINQVPVNATTGLTFASALRAMLRQAPNTVMIGEIRDRETADIAINAALTGHQVFSTLHTNDAPSAVTRLIDIGAKPFLVAAALRASLAQRLVRKICVHCRRAHVPSVRELRALGLSAAQRAGAGFARGAGCAECQGTGYRGRLGIFEIFLVNDEIRSLIYENASASRLRGCARREGRLTLREDGVRKVLAGLTTIEEVLANTIGEETRESFNPPIA